MTHDNTEDGFHEIHLSGKQLVFLFMTGAMVLAFVFLCGLFVGRNLPDVQQAASATAFASGPAPAASAPLTVDDVEPPTPAEVVDELTYHRRLQGEEPPSELPRRPADAARTARAETPEPPRPEPAAARPAAATASTAKPEVTKSEPAKPEAAKPETRIAADVPTSGRPGKLVVQVFASQDPQVASSLVKRLAAKGYPAFLVPPASGAKPAMYRVQVGRYNDRRDAEEVSRRLAKEEQFNPWIFSR